MVTFEQFYNSTLPAIINVINAQGNELVLQRYIIYGLVGMWLLVGGYLLVSKYWRIERRKKN